MSCPVYKLSSESEIILNYYEEQTRELYGQTVYIAKDVVTSCFDAIFCLLFMGSEEFFIMNNSHHSFNRFKQLKEVCNYISYSSNGTRSKDEIKNHYQTILTNSIHLPFNYYWNLINDINNDLDIIIKKGLKCGVLVVINRM